MAGLSKRKPLAEPKKHGEGTLIAYMENKDLIYCQYLYRREDGSYYAVRTRDKGQDPIVVQLTKYEAEDTYNAVNYRVKAI